MKMFCIPKINVQPFKLNSILISVRKIQKALFCMADLFITKFGISDSIAHRALEVWLFHICTLCFS